MSTTIVWTQRITKEVMAGLKELAKDDRRPVTQYIRIVLEDHIAAQVHFTKPNLASIKKNITFKQAPKK